MFSDLQGMFPKVNLLFTCSHFRTILTKVNIENSIFDCMTYALFLIVTF